MNTSIINNNDSVLFPDDINFLNQQSPNQRITIMGQMTTLIESITNLQEDTNNRVEIMEKQDWFKRMIYTVSGKNKASKNEIKKNQDKIVSYISEAVAVLYKMEENNKRAILSLGNRINQTFSFAIDVYNDQLNVKYSLELLQRRQVRIIRIFSAVLVALESKIDSNEAYRDLLHEIEHNEYCTEQKLVGLCNILAQLDENVINDDRKLKNLKSSLSSSKMINRKLVQIRDILNDVLLIPSEEIGIVYLELCNYRDCFPANIIVELIEDFHFLDEYEKKVKNKAMLIQRLLDKYIIDGDAKLKDSDIFDIFVNNKINHYIDNEQVKSIDNKLKEEFLFNHIEVLFNTIKDKILKDEDLSKEIEELKTLANNGNYFAQYKMGVLSFPFINLNSMYINEPYYKEYAQYKNELGLGSVFYDRSGLIRQDIFESFNWFCKSSAQGYIDAQRVIGAIAYWGYNHLMFGPNYVMAKDLFIKAANNGDEWSKTKLLEMKSKRLI